jgi:nitrous oxide reductase accessory protein NosL
MKYVLVAIAVMFIGLVGCQKAEEPSTVPTPAPVPSAVTTADAPVAGAPGQKSNSPVQSPSGPVAQPQ